MTNQEKLVELALVNNGLLVLVTQLMADRLDDVNKGILHDALQDTQDYIDKIKES